MPTHRQSLKHWRHNVAIYNTMKLVLMRRCLAQFGYQSQIANRRAPHDPKSGSGFNYAV